MKSSNGGVLQWHFLAPPSANQPETKTLRIVVD
jgi:hypothetical protein